MRILILGSVALPVPPKAQGGTEWMAYEQARGLSAKGHKVILVGGKDSRSGSCRSPAPGVSHSANKRGAPAWGAPARVTRCGNQGTKNLEYIGIGGGVMGYEYDAKTMEASRKLRLENVYLAEVVELMIKRQKNYDFVLNNLRGGETVLAPLAKMLGKKIANVLHLPLFKELADYFRECQIPIITISNSQRRGFPGLNYAGTVYNGVDMDKFPFSGSRGNYLLMMGTVGWHKGTDIGVEAARRTGMRLVIAGKVRDRDIYNKFEIRNSRQKLDVASHLGGQAKSETSTKFQTTNFQKVDYINEVAFKEKVKLYQGALALLMPIRWREPFGLVMIEAMACGTPVIAYDMGSVREVVKDGETGYIINPKSEIRNSKQAPNSPACDGAGKFQIQKVGVEGLVEAIKRIGEIERRACRRQVEENFTVEKMVSGYEKALLKVFRRENEYLGSN